VILTGHEIAKQVREGRIQIDPFHEDSISPNSYDLSLGDTIIRYTDDVLDTRRENPCETFPLSNNGLTLMPREFYLGCSKEIVGSKHFVPILHGRSSFARLGLFVHVTADLLDIGYHGNLTFQLFPAHAISVYPGDKIAQVSFWVPEGPITLYSGKYQGSIGPVASRSYIDESLPQGDHPGLS